MAEQLSRTAFLNAALSELGAYWLGIECGGCRASVFYPCKLLAKERGESLRVGDVVCGVGNARGWPVTSS
jgi:hypothetical protein